MQTWYRVAVHFTDGSRFHPGFGSTGRRQYTNQRDARLRARDELKNGRWDALDRIEVVAIAVHDTQPRVGLPEVIETLRPGETPVEIVFPPVRRTGRLRGGRGGR